MYPSVEHGDFHAACKEGWCNPSGCKCPCHKNITSIPAAPRLEDTPYVKRLLQTECKIAGKMDQDGQSLYIDVLINGENCIRQFVLNGSTEELEQVSETLSNLIEQRQRDEMQDSDFHAPAERNPDDDRDEEFERECYELEQRAKEM